MKSGWNTGDSGDWKAIQYKKNIQITKNFIEKWYFIISALAT